MKGKYIPFNDGFGIVGYGYLCPKCEHETKFTDCANLLELAKYHKNDPLLLQTLLNSFVSNARSVTFVMQIEFHDVDGFLDWYSDIQEMMRNNNFFKYLKDFRKISVKQKTIKQN